MEFLYRKVLKLLPEYLVHVARSANGDSVFAVFGGHSAAELERRMNRYGSRCPDASQRCKSSNRLR
jgi:hypothetical protein